LGSGFGGGQARPSKQPPLFVPPLSHSTLLDQPSPEDAHDVLDFLRRHFSAGGYSVPFGQTLPAARACCVLGQEDGVAAHRGLSAIVFGQGGGEAFDDEPPAMVEHNV
jgi:hypothetical protein